MHPAIAALTFIFSPADDWVLKRAYELILEPQRVDRSAQTYENLTKKYRSLDTDGGGLHKSADTPSYVIWTEILHENGHYEEAQAWRRRLLENPTLSIDLSDDLRLRLGEAALLEGKIDEAEHHFKEVLATGGPRAIDAKTDLLITSLATGKNEEARKWATELTEEIGAGVDQSRAAFPLALAAYADNNYEDALLLLDVLEDQPRAAYFRGLCHRKLGHPSKALAEWQGIRQRHRFSGWNELAQFQVAETYFALGDDNLSRVACEKALAENPKLSKEFIFRLASLEMRKGDYEGALAKLKDVSMEGDLGERAATVIAESLVKLDQSGHMFRLTARKLPKNPTPLSVYQTAWANAFDMAFDKSMMMAERGLNDFYDPEITPRLLLLQGMAYEHLNLPAEAMATYQTILDSFPTSPMAAQGLNWLTKSYVRLGRYREAVTHAGPFWEALSWDVKREHPEAAFWLGEAHARLGRFDDATRRYGDFLSVAKLNHPIRPYVQFEQAMALAKTGNDGAALALLTDFSKSAEIAAKPEWTELAHVQRGNILFNSNKFEESIVAYRAATSTPKALYYEGLALARLDYYSDALGAWTKLASQFPTSSYTEQGMFRSGRTLFELGRATESVAAFAKYLDWFPDSPRAKDAILQSAHALYNANDFAGAAPLYARYLSTYRTTEDLVSVTPYLAACYVQMKMPLGEIETAMRGLPPVDALASLRWETGAQEYNGKKFEEADVHFARLLTDFPTDDNAHEAAFYRGESLFNAQKWMDAEGALNNYLKLTPEEKRTHGPTALFHKGVAQYQQSRLLLAAKTFEEVVTAYPSDAISNDAKTNLALSYHYLGNFDERDRMKATYGEPPVAEAPKPETPAAEPEQAPVAKQKPYLVEKDKIRPRNLEQKTENVAEITENQATQ